VTATGGALSVTSSNITVNPSLPSSIVVSSGGGQSGTVGVALPLALVAIVEDSYSNPVSGVAVTWAAASGGGAVSGCTNTSDSNGLTHCTFAPGGIVGTNTVTSTATGIATPASFTETGTPGSPTTLTISGGNNQVGQTGHALANNFQVTVTDSFTNLVNGTSVDWSITSGSGTLNVASSTTTLGIASNGLTLSAVGTTTVTATLHGTSTSVLFTASGSQFAHRRTLTINHTKVGTASSTNFPMLFSGTYSYLATTANGGQVTNANGYDIVFATDSLCATPVTGWEIESYTASTGAVDIWVNVATLSSTTDTVIYMCYGNSSITTLQSTGANTWDSNYSGVWHMDDDLASTAVKDSTSLNNGINAANTNTKSSTGEIASALSYNGSGDGTDLGTAVNYVTAGTPFTVELWANATSANGYPVFVELHDTGGNNWELFTSNQGGFTGVDFGSSTGWARGFTNVAAPTGSWHFWVVTYNGGTQSTLANFSLYEDGVLKTLGTPNSFGGHANHNYFGRDDAPNRLTGLLDEIRISKVARSTSWITADYNNQTSPSTFYTVGAEL
jgi:hypothetical protein